MNLISIITPTYNSSRFIEETIKSVLKQSYSNWEMIIVDDNSTDDTFEIVSKYLSNKIKYFKLGANSGAAITRNYAIKIASGNYLAFLDSDDLWDEFKLEKQLDFMIKNNYHFTSTRFQRINENSEKINWYSKYIKIRDYNKLLKRCPGNSTIMYNCDVLGKTYIEDIKKRNDYVMWLSVIKKSKYIYELAEILTSYRIRGTSLSNNKYKLVKYQWFVYRKIERLPLIRSIYILSIHIIRGILKLK